MRIARRLQAGKFKTIKQSMHFNHCAIFHKLPGEALFSASTKTQNSCEGEQSSEMPKNSQKKSKITNVDTPPKKTRSNTTHHEDNNPQPPFPHIRHKKSPQKRTPNQFPHLKTTLSKEQKKKKKKAKRRRPHSRAARRSGAWRRP
jgi:hypothetical protein